MGKVRTKPQVDQNGQETGNTLIEMTYGGSESPFGGVDYSAPPAYIDPKCFADADGFLVVDNKLVVTSLQTIATPQLWGGTLGVILLGFGTFYNSLTGLLNYAFGYIANEFAGPPSGVAYTFYMTAWLPNDISTFYNDTLPVTLFDAQASPQQASISLDAIPSFTPSTTAIGTGATYDITAVGTVDGSPDALVTVTATGGANYAVGDYMPVTQGSNMSGFIRVTAIGGGGSISTVIIIDPGFGYSTGTGDLTGFTEYYSNCVLVINGPRGGPNTYTVPSWAAGYTGKQIVAAMVAAINAGPDPNVTASSSIDGYSIVLTANYVGIDGNNITVEDQSVNATVTLPPPFYFTARVPRNLEGGLNAASNEAPRGFYYPASIASVGGTLYIANLGPMILKYSGPGLFTTSSLYQGVGVLRKFAGSLIGLRVSPQLGTFVQNQDMIFAWSAAEDLDVWDAVAADGNVTGAGFTQIADIGDYLSGLVVSNNTAFIIRSQGLSYALALGSGSDPYQIAHIGLGDEGEGSQAGALCCQYDQTGAYVGNSDIYQISNSISAIGGKVRSMLFAALTAEVFSYISSNACAVQIGGDVYPLIAFQIGAAIFVYNTSNQTWMRYNAPLNTVLPVIRTLLGTLSQLNNFAVNSQFNQTLMCYAQQTLGAGFSPAIAPIFASLVECVPNANSITDTPFIIFPQEELLLGRDVTIDALYVTLWGNIADEVLLAFYFIGQQTTEQGAETTPVTQFFASLILDPAQFNTLEGQPIEVPIFPNGSSLVFTSKSPQLKVTVQPLSDSSINQVRISKIQYFGTFDPSQRPV